MEIKNTDLFLINSGGLSYKVQARNLQESTGTLLVNRGGSSYKCSVSDVEDDVQNNDKLLIERNGISYQVTGQVVKNWFLPPEELIRGLTWSGSRTAAGSSPVTEDTFYDGNPSTGAVFLSSSDSDPYLQVDFSESQGNRWKVTRVVYGAWNNNIANGNWNSFIYGANRQDYRSRNNNGGSGGNSSNIFILKDPGDELELDISTRQDEAWMLEIKISQRVTTQQPEQKLAVGNFYIYGRPA